MLKKQYEKSARETKKGKGQKNNQEQQMIYI